MSGDFGKKRLKIYSVTGSFYVSAYSWKLIDATNSESDSHGLIEKNVYRNQILRSIIFSKCAGSQPKKLTLPMMGLNT